MFRKYYGPTYKVFAALDPERQTILSDELVQLIANYDRGDERGIVVPGEYLEIVLETRSPIAA